VDVAHAADEVDGRNLVEEGARLQGLVQGLEQASANEGTVDAKTGKEK